MKICMIGCGAHAYGYHGPSQRKYAARFPDTVLAGCCDLNPKNAQAYASEFGFHRHYTHWEEMILKESPDAVCVVVPPKILSSIAAPLLREGIPLLLEKPPGLTRQALEELIEAAQLGSCKNQVAFNRRYTPLISKGVSLLESHLSPESVQLINYDLVRYDRRESDFSVTAIHAMDAALFLARSPYASARFHFTSSSSIGPVGESCMMEAVCRSGTQVRCNFLPMAGAVLERVAIHGIDHTLTIYLPMWNGFDSPGLLRFWQKDRLICSIAGNELSESKEMFELSGFYDETEAFFQSVREDRPTHPTLEESISQVILMEGYRKHQKSSIVLPQDDRVLS